MNLITAIPFMECYLLDLVTQRDGSSRYAPYYFSACGHGTRAGWWQPLLPEDKVRLTIGEAQQDCLLHAGREN